MLEPAGYHTHFPVLAAALHLVPRGRVLELGAGNWSTVLLHLCCFAAGRPLATLESNPEWLARFARLQSRAGDKSNHRLQTVEPTSEGWARAIDLELELAAQAGHEHGHLISVAFVDQSPEPERRRSIERLRPHTELFVVHDVDPVWDSAFGLQELIASFRYSWIFSVTTPLTALLSDTCPIPFDDRASLPAGTPRAPSEGA